MNRNVRISEFTERNAAHSFRVRLKRRAYTLIEALLALSLAGILLAGVFAAMEQSWRMSASGREEMERAQLARALVQRIETDIRSITYVAPPPVEETAAMTTTTPATIPPATDPPKTDPPQKNPPKKDPPKPNPMPDPGSDTTSATGTTTTEPPVPNSKPLGIRGSSQMLEISISRPRRELLGGAVAVSPTLKTSDLRDVTYSFIAAGSATMSGLIRTEGDRMAVETVEANGGAANQISVGQAMAPEISAISFRYFDGRQWLTSWDSDMNGRVPRAVEVNFEFPPPRRQPPMFNIAVSQSMNRFRSVIAIPVSDPFPKEFAQ